MSYWPVKIRKVTWPVTAFFAALLLTGFAVFDDYGISWDEFIQRDYGSAVVRYVAGVDDDLETHKVRFYGPVVEGFLVAAEKMLGLDDSRIREVYLLRHILIFLIFFTATIFFYRLCRRVTGSTAWALLGTSFLVLSPRIFAHAFYNSKDLPFMSLFIIAMYTAVRFLDERTPRWAVLHGLACALAIDVRIMGALIPVYTIVFYLPAVRRWDKALTCFVLSAAAFTVLFWPTLWRNPVGNVVEAIGHLGRHPWYGDILFFGKDIPARELPWWYIPGWILVTTPVLYSIAFIAGTAAIIIQSRPLNVSALIRNRNGWLMMAWFFVPVIFVIAVRAVLYDAWRQMFFVYPAMIVIALIGLKSVWDRAGRFYWIKGIIAVMIAVSLIHIGRLMVVMHPFQNVYFNIFAGRDFSKLPSRFEMDYWGLSYRKALEYIARTDQRDQILVYAANSPGKSNRHMLRPEDQKRIHYVKNPRDADYFISNFRNHPREYDLPGEVFHVTVNGAKIVVVHQLKGL